MNQNNPETHALTARCPMEDAIRLRALARSHGVTPSAIVARLIHAAVSNVAITPEDAAWGNQRRQANLRRRKLQDERTWHGQYRKPGWENLPTHANKHANEQ